MNLNSVQPSQCEPISFDVVDPGPSVKATVLGSTKLSIKVGAEGVYSNQGAEDQCLQEVFDFYLELLPPYYLTN